jgi:predicted Abi (CAAX) family protease
LRVKQTGVVSAVLGESLRSLRRLPDIRAAIEGLILFLVVLVAGALAVQAGILRIDPAPREEIRTLWLSVILFPVLAEELIFRSWLPRGAWMAAAFSLVAFVVWHPLQAGLGLATAQPEFRDPGFLMLVAILGGACTLARLRSGSIWPGVVIHWGVVILWLALFGGSGAPSAVQPS